MGVKIGFQGGTLSGACPAGGVGGHAPRQAGGFAACPAGSRTAVGTTRCSRTQLDLTGHDPKPASRWAGTLRDYGRHGQNAVFTRREMEK